LDFGGNGCEKDLNNDFNAKASQSCQRPTSQAIFFERNDNVTVHIESCLRDFLAFFLLDIPPSKM